MSTTWQLESTAGCSGAPIAVFALAQVGLAFERTIRPDGYFLATYGAAGPLLRRDDDEVVVGLLALLRRLREFPGGAAFFPDAQRDAIEGWLALALDALGPAAGSIRNGAEGEARAAALATLREGFARLDAQLAVSAYLCGDRPTAADWPWIALPAEGPLHGMLPARVRAYAARLRG